MDVYVESRILLERLANSIHDRMEIKKEPFCFSVAECQIVEKWIKDIIKQIEEENMEDN